MCLLVIKQQGLAAAAGSVAAAGSAAEDGHVPAAPDNVALPASQGGHAAAAPANVAPPATEGGLTKVQLSPSVSCQVCAGLTR